MTIPSLVQLHHMRLMMGPFVIEGTNSMSRMLLFFNVFKVLFFLVSFSH